MIASAIGDHVPNSYAVVTLFGIDGLPLIIVDGSWSSRCLNYCIDQTVSCRLFTEIDSEVTARR